MIHMTWRGQIAKSGGQIRPGLDMAGFRPGPGPDTKSGETLINLYVCMYVYMKHLICTVLNIV